MTVAGTSWRTSRRQTAPANDIVTGLASRSLPDDAGYASPHGNDADGPGAAVVTVALGGVHCQGVGETEGPQPQTRPASLSMFERALSMEAGLSLILRLRSDNGLSSSREARIAAARRYRTEVSRRPATSLGV